MKTIFNTFKAGLLLITFIGSISLVSCGKDQELEIQNDFPFEVNVMPIPKEIANGQTVEMRFTIQRSGNYSNTKYFLRYFQFDGEGILTYYEEEPYLPNDLYQIPKEEFRLYYTSASTISQSFDVWISDNFGNEKQLSFKFNTSN